MIERAVHYQLPWTVFGRPVRPLALSFTVLLFAVAADMFTAQSDYANGFEHDNWPGVMVGGVALTGAIAFLIGWWGRREGWMQSGLLMAAAVFAVAMVNTVVAKGFGKESVWIGFALLIASVGSYTIERLESVRVKRRKKVLANFPDLPIQ